MMLYLLACSEPGLLSSVSEVLADEALAESEEGLQMVTALSGLAAETCLAGTVNGYTFTGRSASALGITSAVVTIEDTTEIWTFSEAGLDAHAGTLEVRTDGQRDDLAISWTADGLTLAAELEVRACGSDAAVIGGSATWTSSLGVVAMTLIGEAPANGVVYSPPLANTPVGGQIRAEDEDLGWTILLVDASTLAADPPAWPGTASGDDWTQEIDVRWP